MLFLMSKSSFLVKLIGKSLLKTGQTNKNRKSTNEQQTEAAMFGAIRSSDQGKFDFSCHDPFNADF